ELFRSADWVRLDRGTFTQRQAIDAVCARLPERLHGAVEQLTLHWDAERPEVPGMFELVRELSEAGYELCLLTNASIRHHEYWPTFRFAPYFGGRIMLSAEWKLLKPERAFYEKAIKLLGFDPATSLFIDDQPTNIEGGERCGIPGVVFYNDVPYLRHRLRELGVNISD
ncbi:MAG: HAD-IA family hydrolase, partial [Clostridia bacterium]|nr:HAD-IA family hydrolase [Clostridia bacterium]